jgi:MFS family permease
MPRVMLVSLIGLGSLLGRFAVGPLADRMGHIVSLAAMYAGLGAMLLVWWVASGWWLLALFAVVFGVCYGAYDALGAYDLPILAGAALSFLAAGVVLPLMGNEKVQIVHRG